MKVLGIHLHKGYVRHAVLDGTRKSPIYIEGGRTQTPDPTDVPPLMDWFETKWRQMISDYSPDHIAYRLTLNPLKEQLFYVEFPLGILNLVAFQRSISISCYTPKQFTPIRLRRSKSTDLYKLCDTTFGKHPPYWDTNQKYAALVAWFAI